MGKEIMYIIIHGRYQCCLNIFSHLNATLHKLFVCYSQQFVGNKILPCGKNTECLPILESTCVRVLINAGGSDDDEEAAVVIHKKLSKNKALARKRPEKDAPDAKLKKPRVLVEVIMNYIPILLNGLGGLFCNTSIYVVEVVCLLIFGTFACLAINK